MNNSNKNKDWRTMILLSRVLTVATLFLFAACSGPETFYVSVHGNDKNSGTKEKPFASLKRARNEVRNYKAKNGDKPVRIFLRGGTYLLNETFELTQQDSGTVDNPVIYSSYPGEEVAIQGGRQIPIEKISKVTGKTIKKLLLPEAREKIRQVDLKSLGFTDFGNIRNVGYARPYGPVWMEVFINKKPMRLARWPNKGYIPMGKVLDEGSVPRKNDFRDRGGQFTYTTNRPSRWKYSNDIRICGYFRYGFADDAVKLARIDTIKKVFTTNAATLYGFGSAADDPIRRWYAFNILEELDYPGEYYIDRDKGILYFYSAEDVQSLEVSMLEDPLIAMEGASNVHIKNIIFENSRGMGIYMDNTDNNRIENCTFRNLGIVAICIGKGIEPFNTLKHDGSGKPVSRKIGNFQQHLYRNTTFNRRAGINNGIINCKIYQTGAGGIHLGGGDRLTLKPAGNFVENCTIHDWNRIEKSYRAAIDISGVGNRISHCEIYNAPSMAILLHGNNHVIEYNNVHDVCLVVDDQGTLYYGRDPSERGHEVRSNFFHHIGNGRIYTKTYHGTSVIYHDDGACGMKVSGNIFYKTGYRTVLIGGGSDNSYTNNIFIESPVAIHVDNRVSKGASGKKGGIYDRRLTAVHFDHPPYSERYPVIVNYWDEEPGIPKRNTVSKNVFYNVEKIVNGEKKWLEFMDDNWITEENPGFVNEEKMNFQLREDARVFENVPDFKMIDFKKIGVRAK